jgi:hypothetical protein
MLHFKYSLCLIYLSLGLEQFCFNYYLKIQEMEKAISDMHASNVCPYLIAWELLIVASYSRLSSVEYVHY